MSESRWCCGAVQPMPPPPLRPYRCSEPYGHTGPHRAIVDGEILAEWDAAREAMT